MVISQTRRVHDQVEDLLQSLANCQGGDRCRRRCGASHGGQSTGDTLDSRSTIARSPIAEDSQYDPRRPTEVGQLARRTSKESTETKCFSTFFPIACLSGMFLTWFGRLKECVREIASAGSTCVHGGGANVARRRKAVVMDADAVEAGPETLPTRLPPAKMSKPASAAAAEADSDAARRASGGSLTRGYRSPTLAFTACTSARRSSSTRSPKPSACAMRG